MPNAPINYSWPGYNTYAWPPVPFPPTITPSVWFDGNQQAYSDLAGTLPVSSGLIRRINEPASTGGAWTTPSDPERPYRDSNSVRFECIGSAGGYQMTRPNVGGIPQNACTIIMSTMLRDNSFAGQSMGLIRSDDLSIGVWTAGALIFVFSTPITWNPTTLALVPGVRNTLLVEYNSVGMSAILDANGTVTSESRVQALPSSAVPGNFRMGVDGVGYTYNSTSQAIIIPRVLTAQEKTALFAYVNAQVLPPAYPNDRALLAFAGDSITRGTGANYGFTYPFLGLSNIRSTKPLTENCDCAIGGTGVTNILRPGSTFYRANQFYSSQRIKNIMTIFLGTNDLANGNGVAYTLNGTGAPDNAGVYAACDAARIAGWKVILCTLLPRSDAMAVSQATFDAARAAFNTDVRANWASHADALCDFAAVAGMGADGDSNNTANYSTDKIHPINAGHSLLEPTYRAAALSLL